MLLQKQAFSQRSFRKECQIGSDCRVGLQESKLVFYIIA